MKRTLRRVNASLSLSLSLSLSRPRHRIASYDAIRRRAVTTSHTATYVSRVYFEEKRTWGAGGRGGVRRRIVCIGFRIRPACSWKQETKKKTSTSNVRHRKIHKQQMVFACSLWFLGWKVETYMLMVLMRSTDRYGLPIVYTSMGKSEIFALLLYVSRSKIIVPSLSTKI